MNSLVATWECETCGDRKDETVDSDHNLPARRIIAFRCQCTADGDTYVHTAHRLLGVEPIMKRLGRTPGDSITVRLADGTERFTGFTRFGDGVIPRAATILDERM